jgi:tripartite-type tricarboxylate transporter receptor subunit TctC
VFAKSDVEVVNSTPAEFADFIRKDSAKWTKVVRDANIKLE